MAYRLTVRAKASVTKERHHDLSRAVEAMRGHVHTLQAGAGRATTGGPLMRKFEPVQQVVARIEIRGKGGVDVRGDGSAEAYTGRLTRTLVDQRPGESPVDALARELGV